ncbi:uncharacterized protein METZ01_LOCUS267389 [marine metagenome]|uniref:Uncharacterized protein n=1 Tax=marine metagenome TaxID=408172 RepID=A0A382JS95_9ZZZZ
MKFSKDDYILRNFSKIKHKSWELYVITRIIHLLNDPEIEFVCQQLIRTPNMKRYLADLCFPALKLYIEIDELQHTKNQNQIDDEHRKREIIDAINFDEKRIKVFDDQNKIRKLNEINDEILEVIEELKDRKKKLKKSGKFVPWNYEKKFSPEPHLERGYIDVKDNVVFLNHRDALRCFGYKGGHYQRALWRMKGKKRKDVWFPKIYKNDLWNNSLSDDNKKIIMKLDSGKSLVDWFAKERGERDFLEKIKSGRDSVPTVVFAHYNNILGQTVYKFLGEFIVSHEESDEFSTISNRTRTKVYLS